LTEATFEVEVTLADLAAFANLCGDMNPLHNDFSYAKATSYGKQVLHGAFSAGLISRLAGMHLPGRGCLLHSMNLRFISPIFPPARLRVSGRLTASEMRGGGKVDAVVQDAVSSNRYVEATYEFDRSGSERSHALDTVNEKSAIGDDEASIVVTGASGGLGQAVLARLGKRGIGVSRSGVAGAIHARTVQQLAEGLAGRSIGSIVHCGWPAPDNERLIAIDHLPQSIEHHVSGPIRDMILLAQLLSKRGKPNALMILIGSTFSEPGRHAYRMPLYSLAKSLIPNLARNLAVELAPSGRRCVAITFDVIDGGMNKAMSRANRVSQADRSPFGRLATPDEAAGQILWLLDNESILATGGTFELSGGSLP
jgi:NAD(P)-dependent dehydrogenase (short-subunit alcohol dehydrogenase family)/acyl dehydratase